MIYTDDIRKIILKLASELPPGNTFDSSDVARKLDQVNWAELTQQVSIVADVLSREGKIITENLNGELRYRKN
jgi:hypothetical protein